MLSDLESVFGYKGTLETIKAATTSDEEVCKLNEKLLRAMEQEADLEVVRSAYLARKDMLVSLGAHERSERKLTPTS